MAQQDTKRKALEAIARGGTAGLDAFQRERRAMQTSHNEAIAGVAGDAPWDPPAAATAEAQSIAATPGNRYLQALDYGAVNYAQDTARQNTALENYMRSASAAEPLVRAAAEAEQQAQAKAMWEQPEYQQRATLTGELGAERERQESERQRHADAVEQREREAAQARAAAEAAEASRPAERYRLYHAATKGDSGWGRSWSDSFDPEADRQAQAVVAARERDARQANQRKQTQQAAVNDYLAQLAQPDADVASRIATERYGYPEPLARGLAAGWFPQPTLGERYEQQTGFASPMQRQSWENAGLVERYGSEAIEEADALGVTPDAYAELAGSKDYKDARQLADDIIVVRLEDEEGTSEDQLRYELQREGYDPVLIDAIVREMQPRLVSPSFDPGG